MTIRESMYFSYAGKRSDQMGILNVNMESGMLEEPFTATRSIQEVKIRGRDEPYFQDYTREPLQFKVNFAFMDKWDETKIRDVARWLGDQKYYQPLYFTSNLHRWYYCLPVEDSRLIHNSLSEGYCQLTMRCNAPYAYSPIFTESHNLTSNSANGTNITFVNNGDMDCYPLLYVQVVSGGSFSIVNNSNGGETLDFTGISANETLTIDNELETIISDIPLTTRYDNMNGKFVKFVRGNNYLNIKGNVKLKISTQYKLLQG